MFIKEFKDLLGYDFMTNKICDRYEYHDKERFYIYGDGLYVPVFHIIPDDGYADICICLFEPKYYQYNHKVYKYAVDGEELDEFLRKPSKSNPKFSNWELLVVFWKADHIGEEIKYEIPTEQPDYTTIEDNPIKRRSLARWLKAKWYA